MDVLGLFQQIRPQEIIIILFLVLVLFGAKKLPEIGRGMGKGIKEFKEGIKDVSDEVKGGLNDEPHAKPDPAPSVTADPDRQATSDPDRPAGG